MIADTDPTCTGDLVFRREEPYVTFEKCIELLYSHKNANFVWFNDVTMQGKGFCGGYEKCDLKKTGRLPKRSGVTIQKLTSL